MQIVIVIKEHSHRFNHGGNTYHPGFDIKIYQDDRYTPKIPDFAHDCPIPAMIPESDPETETPTFGSKQEAEGWATDWLIANRLLLFDGAIDLLGA